MAYEPRVIEDARKLSVSMTSVPIDSSIVGGRLEPISFHSGEAVSS